MEHDGGVDEDTITELWGFIILDYTTLPPSLSLSSADLQVVLSVQRPGGERLLRGARYAPQTLGVKGQAHDRLRVGFG